MPPASRILCEERQREGVGVERGPEAASLSQKRAGEEEGEQKSLWKANGGVGSLEHLQSMPMEYISHT